MAEVSFTTQTPHKERGLVNLPIWQEVTFFLVGWLGLKVIAYLMALVCISLKESNPILYVTLYDAISYGIIFFGLIALCITNHQKILSSFKKIAPYFIGIGIGFAIIATSSLYSNIVSQFIKMEVNDNESIVRQMTVAYPILSFILLVFVGPICEELTYRLGLFSLCAKYRKWLAYLVTILVFALIHFNFFATGENALLYEVLNLPSYAIAAAGLCLAYDFFGLSASISAHVLNNMVSVISILILNSLGS